MSDEQSSVAPAGPVDAGVEVGPDDMTRAREVVRAVTGRLPLVDTDPDHRYSVDVIAQAIATEREKCAQERDALRARVARLEGALEKITLGPTTPGMNFDNALDLARDVIGCSQAIARAALRARREAT